MSAIEAERGATVALGDYEDTRRRHGAFVQKSMSSYVARLQWSRAEIEAESAFVKVEDVLGRNEDTFTYASGIVVHPHIFRSVLSREVGVQTYQVRQTVAGAEVDVASSAAVDLDALRRRLEQSLTAVGLRGASIVVRRVAAVERQDTGKLKRFIPLAGSR